MSDIVVRLNGKTVSLSKTVFDKLTRHRPVYDFEATDFETFNTVALILVDNFDAIKIRTYFHLLKLFNSVNTLLRNLAFIYDDYKPINKFLNHFKDYREQQYPFLSVKDYELNYIAFRNWLVDKDYLKLQPQRINF
jgi:hypothetical protein